MGIEKNLRDTASALTDSALRRVRSEARSAVMPWVALAVALSLYAMRKRRR